MTKSQETGRRLRRIILFGGILYTMVALAWVFLPLFVRPSAALFGDDFDPAGLYGVPFPLPTIWMDAPWAPSDAWGYGLHAATLVGVLLLAQWALLRPGRSWATRLTVTGRPVKSAVIAAAAMAMLLSVGVAALLLELPNWWEATLDSPLGLTGIWVCMAILWGVWAWIFLVYWRQGDRYTHYGKLIRALVAGSIAESIVAIPVHIWATHQRGCYCARGTYTTLVFAGTVLLWAFGPGIILLYAREKYRRARLFPRCIRCGYDLTGNVSGVCPECGAKIEDY